MRRSALILSALLIAGGGLAAGSAQVVEGVDPGAIRARAKAQAKDLEAFTNEVAKRGAAVREEALGVQRGAAANRARIASVKTGGAKGVFDFDQMIADADKAAAGDTTPKPRFVAFASLSMPPASLKTLFRDVTAAGGIVVFRGFKNNSVKEFMAGIRAVVDKKDQLEGVGLDPRLFRAFDVTVVPTYVVVSADFEACGGFHCTTALPPYDRMVGNVTAAYALRTIAGGRGPGAATARVYLGRLERAGR